MTPAGARRRNRTDAVETIDAAERLARLRFVGRDVLTRHDHGIAGCGRHRFDDLVRDRAAIKSFRPFAGDISQAGGKLRVAPGLPGPERRSIRVEVERAHGGHRGVIGAAVPKSAGEARLHDEALLGEPDRGLEETRPWADVHALCAPSQAPRSFRARRRTIRRGSHRARAAAGLAHRETSWDGPMPAQSRARHRRRGSRRRRRRDNCRRRCPTIAVRRESAPSALRPPRRPPNRPLATSGGRPRTRPAPPRRSCAAWRPNFRQTGWNWRKLREPRCRRITTPRASPTPMRTAS